MPKDHAAIGVVFYFQISCFFSARSHDHSFFIERGNRESMMIIHGARELFYIKNIPISRVCGILIFASKLIFFVRTCQLFVPASRLPFFHRHGLACKRFLQKGAHVTRKRIGIFIISTWVRHSRSIGRILGSAGNAIALRVARTRIFGGAQTDYSSTTFSGNRASRRESCSDIFF